MNSPIESGSLHVSQQNFKTLEDAMVEIERLQKYFLGDEKGKDEDIKMGQFIKNLELVLAGCSGEKNDNKSIADPTVLNEAFLKNPIYAGT